MPGIWLRCSWLVVLSGLAAGGMLAADYYKLPGTKRIEKDLYRSGKTLIETRYCYHYSNGEDAILKYEGRGEYSGSKIIWQDDTSCEVKRVVTDI
jgi:hypothetical protein